MAAPSKIVRPAGDRVKTDAKDAGTITDLLAQGHFVRFPFLTPAYADLRYLVAARERLTSWCTRSLPSFMASTVS